MSPVEGKHFLFVVGAPRSGTTWLHRMLHDHPATVGLKAELTVFHYLDLWDRRYRFEKAHIDQGKWVQGAPLLYDEASFYDGLRTIALDAYTNLSRTKPEASHVLDKHPGYAVCLPLVHRLLPKAKVVHIIRDGREVAVSMMSAKRRIGFGEGEVAGATREWARHVRQARAAAPLLGPHRYMEVRYEDLVKRPEEGLAAILRFAGLEAPADLVQRIAAAHHINVNQVSRGDTEVNALRATPDAIWKAKLSLEERWIMDRMAGDLLKELGYGRARWWATDRWDPLRLRWGLAKGRLMNALGSAWHTWKRPLPQRVPVDL